MAKMFYDPEYDRIVSEDVIRRQYEWFSTQPWFNKSYEEFAADNFIEEVFDNERDCLCY